MKPPFASMKRVELPLISVSIDSNQAYAVLHAKALQVLIHLKVVVGVIIDERDQPLHSKTSALQQSASRCVKAEQALILLGRHSHSYIVGSTRLLACQAVLLDWMLASFSGKESPKLHDIEHMVVTVTCRTACHIVFLVRSTHCCPFWKTLHFTVSRMLIISAL